MSYSEKINLNVSADISISIIFLIYSLFLLSMAIWGCIIFPKFCTSDKLKLYFRIMILLSSCSVILIIGFMRCKLSCRTLSIIQGKSGTFLEQDSEYKMPSFLIFFWVIFSSICITIQSLIHDELGYITPEENCNTENFFYYREINNIGIGISSFSLTIFVLSIIFKMKNYFDKRNADTLENEVENEREELLNNSQNPMLNLSNVSNVQSFN